MRREGQDWKGGVKWEGWDEMGKVGLGREGRAGKIGSVGGGEMEGRRDGIGGTVWD
jgi:hypothetical protein